MRILVRVMTLVVLAGLIGLGWVIVRGGGLRWAGERRGVVLVYDVPQDQPAGTAEKMAEVLKEQIDPLGRAGITFKALGSSQLEIRMPVGPRAEEAWRARQTVAGARAELRGLGFLMGHVIEALMLPPAQRDRRFEELAHGDSGRHAQFKKLASAQDSAQQAMRDTTDTTEAVNARADARARLMDALKESAGTDSWELLAEQRLAKDSDELYGAMRHGDGERVARLRSELAPELAKWRAVAQTSPGRSAALEGLVNATEAYLPLRSNDDSAKLQQRLRFPGVLAFHILYDPTSAPPEDQSAAEEMILRFERDGAAAANALKKGLQFFEVRRPEEFKGQPALLHGRDGVPWVLCYTTPEKSMVRGEGPNTLELEEVSPGVDANGDRIISFKLDAAGARRFGDLTESNLRRQLAIVLDGKVVSAPMLQSRIEGRGMISGHFTAADVDELILTLRGGAMPGRVAQEPASTTFTQVYVPMSGPARVLLWIVVAAVVDLGVAGWAMWPRQRVRG